MNSSYDSHVVAYDRDQLSDELATFMDTYRTTLVDEVRMAVPVLVQLAMAIEDATTMAELFIIRNEMADFIRAIRHLTPKN